MRKKQDRPEEELDLIGIPAIADRTVAAPEDIPETTVKRLPRYFRCLRELFNRDVMKVSSKELSEYTGVSASQLRQDLKYFGGAGQCGYGYNVKRLYSAVSERMGVAKKYTAVMIGAGKLGRSLCESMLFEQRGIWVKGIFDASDDVIGKTVGENTVRNVSELCGFCLENRIDIAVFCIPAADEEELLGIIRGAGIRGIWNFSPCEIAREKAGVPVVNICTGDSLMYLQYEMSKAETEKK